jgi:hypothetical protein
VPPQGGEAVAMTPTAKEVAASAAHSGGSPAAALEGGGPWGEVAP